MTGSELLDAMTRTGQERAARKLAIESGLVTAEKAAMMTCLDVCNALAKGYVMVSNEGDKDRITLVRKEDEKEYWRMVKCLDR